MRSLSHREERDNRLATCPLQALREVSVPFVASRRGSSRNENSARYSTLERAASINRHPTTRLTAAKRQGTKGLGVLHSSFFTCVEECRVQSTVYGILRRRVTRWDVSRGFLGNSKKRTTVLFFSLSLSLSFSQWKLEFPTRVTNRLPCASRRIRFTTCKKNLQIKREIFT